MNKRHTILTKWKSWFSNNSILGSNFFGKRQQICRFLVVEIEDLLLSVKYWFVSLLFSFSNIRGKCAFVSWIEGTVVGFSMSLLLFESSFNDDTFDFRIAIVLLIGWSFVCVLFSSVIDCCVGSAVALSNWLAII
jgi:hypothetical protein